MAPKASTSQPKHLAEALGKWLRRDSKSPRLRRRKPSKAEPEKPTRCQKSDSTGSWRASDVPSRLDLLAGLEKLD